jgi:hypothetical protein
VIRQATFEGPNGTTYLTPDRIGESAGRGVRAVHRRRAVAEQAGARQARHRDRAAPLLLRRNQLRRDRDRRAVAALHPARHPGRHVHRRAPAAHQFQFKGWPVAYSQRVLGRAVFGQRGGADQALHLAHLLVGTTIAGYIAMTAKDYLKGYDRRKFVNPMMAA